MTSPVRDIISDREDNSLHLDDGLDSSSQDDSLLNAATTHPSPSIQKHRLCKTKHSQVYFSDSDDLDEPEPDSNDTHPQLLQLDADKQIIPPIQPTRFQQQHHRRHRQFHKTFTPFDLRQLNSTTTTTEAVVGEHPQPIKSQAAHPQPEVSSDEDSDTANDLLTASQPNRQSYRDSPGHHRVGNKPSGQPPPPPPTSSSPSHHRSSGLQLIPSFVREARNRRRNRNMLVNYGPESICVLALILTTFATFQNVPPKISKLAAPQPFFAKGSLVHDYPAGNLNVVQDRVKMSDISMVLFYAPWSAECQFARHSFEQVARLFADQMHFAAVNCWQPGGECRHQYAKIHDWPVAMAYMKSGLAVPYTGRWSVGSVTRFVQSLMRPIHRIIDNDDMLRLMMSHDAVVVAFLDVNQYGEDYAAYYSTAIKWLEQDPFQTVAFGVVTGASAVGFDVVQHAPLVRTYLWNGTMEYESTNVWTQPKLTAWIGRQIVRVSAWLNPPGTKSNTLAPYLRTGPVLVLFTPRIMDVSESIDAYDMLRQLGLEYNNCESLNQSWIKDMSRVYITEVRKQHHDDHQKFAHTCDRIAADAKRALSAVRRRQCTVHPSTMHHSLAFSHHIENATKAPVDFCQIGPRNWDESTCANLNECRSTKPSTRETSQWPADQDPRSPLNLSIRALHRRCQLLANGRRRESAQVRFFEPVTDGEQFDRIAGLACAANRSISFVALDATLYHVFAERLGVDVLRRSDQTAAVIIDHEMESTYVMTEPVSTVGLIDFVHNFTNRKMSRFLNARQEDLFERRADDGGATSDGAPSKGKFSASPETTSRGRIVSLRDIDSHSFGDEVLNSNKTVIVLFHSAQCAMCSLLAQALLMAAHLLQDLRSHLDFVRIDGDRNDLPWHYTIDQYPTLIAFPPANSALDSRIFPNAVSATVPNVLAFVLANLRRPQRLYALLLVCNHIRSPGDDCSRTLRHEVSDSIALSLRQWRSAPHRRSSILRRLQALQRIYLQLHRLDATNGEQRKRVVSLALEVAKVWPPVVT